MLKKVLIGVGIIIGIIAIATGVAVYYFKPDENLILTKLKNNPNNSAIKLVRNGDLIVSNNVNKLMPLASTVKIIFAIEYAVQAASGEISPDEMIDLDALDNFYVENTDGGAHPAWLDHSKDKIQNNKIAIREIAKGMIEFSSNANTEWLGERLGINRINARIDSLGVNNHTEIYYFTSALFVGKERFPGVEGTELEEKLKSLSIEEYMKIAADIHEKLISDPNYKNDLGDLGLNIQKVWSDCLPASTVEEYAGIMKKLNSKTYFDDKVYEYLDQVMESVMESTRNQSWLKHCGMKGGSTASVLTKAVYATDLDGNTTELAYFFDNLDLLENTRLQASINQFELEIAQNPKFLDKIKSELGK